MRHIAHTELYIEEEMKKMILNIGNKRELFWDDYLVDKSLTTAFPRLMQPTFKECCFQFDQDI